MKKPSHRDLAILAISAICFIVIGFAISRIFTPTPIINQQPDVSKYIFTIDSLKVCNSNLETKTLLLKVRIDSINNAKEINHSNLNHNVAKTKTFTPTASKRYMDSLFAAETR